MRAMPNAVTGIPNLIFLQIKICFNKVSSYLHHIGPRPSCYSVHVIFPFRQVIGPALVISQVARKWSLAVDPKHRAVLAYSNRAFY